MTNRISLPFTLDQLRTRSWGSKTSELLAAYAKLFSSLDPAFPFARHTVHVSGSARTAFSATVRTASTIDNRSLSGTYSDEDIAPHRNLPYGGYIFSDDEQHEWIPESRKSMKFWIFGDPVHYSSVQINCIYGTNMKPNCRLHEPHAVGKDKHVVKHVVQGDKIYIDDF